jgi:hypothetical protein
MMLSKGFFRWFRLLAFRAKRAEFYRDLAEMFRRNEALMGFMEGEIANSVRTRQRSRAMALRLMLARYQAGDHAGRIGHLMETVVPRGDAMMLVGVDRAGDKAEALEALAAAVDKQVAMKRIVLSHSALPLVMMPLCYVLIVLLSEVIVSVDRSAPVYVKDELWRGMNGWAKVAAELTQAHGLLMMGGLVALFAAAVLSLPRWRGRGRLAVESLPVYSLYRDFQSGLLFTSMAMLLKTGGTLRGSIEDIAQRSSLWMRWHLNRVLHSLDDNPTGTLEAFSRGVLSPHMLARASTLLRTADSFSDVLVELGTREESRVVAEVKKAALAANVALIGLLVATAGFMGVATITVPGKFSNLMQPVSKTMLRQSYEAKQRAGAPP